MLPPLHQLSIGGVADPPLTRARRKAKLALNLKAVDQAKPKKPPRSVPNRAQSAPPDDAQAKMLRDLYSNPCTYHSYGSPFVYEIAQEQAAEWYELGTPLGKGAYGETRKYQVPKSELRGGPFWVVIKRMFNQNSAAKEEAAHLRIWQMSDEHCRKYLAMPACMKPPTGPVEDLYTVQTLVSGPAGTETQTWFRTALTYNRTLRALPLDVKETIARQYGDMMGCFVKARMLHGDLHADNVMVTHNLAALATDPTLPAHFRFCAIDWGLADTLTRQSFDDNGVPRTICSYDDFYARYNPKAPVEDDHLQRSWRLMFGIKEYSDRWARGEFCRGEKWNGMYILLYALFFPTTWEEELPRDSVTRAQLVDWARVAYLERLGAEYPPEEREKMDAVIRDERFRYKRDRKYKV